MNQQELLYAYSSLTLTGALFLLIILFNEIGFRTGRYVQEQTSEEVKSLTGSIQASILGLLALLLGFTFSMSMQRFDSRNLALIEEVNSLGTLILRSELLPLSHRQATQDKLRQYIDLRIQIGQVDLTQVAQRSAFNQKINAIQQELWNLAIATTEVDPRPITTGLYINSLNAAIDSQGRRNALLQMHVPEVVLLLLFVVFVASGGMLGYSSGLGGKRIVAPAVLIAFLISLIVFIIIDLDRPKRGIIQVDQNLMQELSFPEHTANN